MNALSTTLICACFINTASAQGCELSGIYVNKEMPHYRIEFLTNGECYYSYASGASPGHYTRKVPSPLDTDLTVTIVATDSRGIVIQRPNDWEPLGKGFAISGLWPGKWTVQLRKRKGDQLIAEKAVTLQGTETVSCDLVP